MHDGFLRVAAATPSIQVANCPYNARQVIDIARRAAKKQVSAIVFPELCLTGCTCGDLFLQQALLDSAVQALETVLTELQQESMICIVGLPVAADGSLYNCAAVCYQGKLLGVVPKNAVTEENRCFAPAPSCREINLCGQTVPFGVNLLFSCETMPDFQFGIESGHLQLTTTRPNIPASEGATVLFHLSADAETVGKTACRKAAVTGLSAGLNCTYVYANAGQGESATDHVYAGHDLIAENGAILAESPLFDTGFIYADTDLQLLRQEQHRSIGRTADAQSHCQKIKFSLPVMPLLLERSVQANPFLPPQLADLPSHCETILNIQAHGLKNRKIY